MCVKWVAAKNIAYIQYCTINSLILYIESTLGLVASAADLAVYTLYGRGGQRVAPVHRLYFQYLMGVFLLILTSILGNCPPEDHDCISLGLFHDPARAPHPEHELENELI